VGRWAELDKERGRSKLGLEWKGQEAKNNIGASGQVWWGNTCNGSEAKG